MEVVVAWLFKCFGSGLKTASRAPDLVSPRLELGGLCKVNLATLKSLCKSSAPGCLCFSFIFGGHGTTFPAQPRHSRGTHAAHTRGPQVTHACSIRLAKKSVFWSGWIPQTSVNINFVMVLFQNKVWDYRVTRGVLGGPKKCSKMTRFLVINWFRWNGAKLLKMIFGDAQ